MYELKKLFNFNESGDIWWGDQQEKQDNIYDITDKGEIKRISEIWVNIEDNEEIKWSIDSASKKELENIAKQCNNIIDGYFNKELANKEWIDDNKVSQAILSLIRINQILWTNNLWWEKPELNSQDSKKTLLNFCGTSEEGIDKLVKALGGSEKIRTIINNFIWTEKASFDKDQEDKEKVWNEAEKPLEDLDTLLNSINWNTINEKFKNLRAKLNRDKNAKKDFQDNIQILLNNLKIEWVDTFNLKPNFYSDEVKLFQRAVYNASLEGWEQYKKAWRRLSDWMVDKWENPEKAFDWLLWANTLASIIEFSRAWLTFEPKKFEKAWKANFDAVERILMNEWIEYSDVPSDIVALEKFWEFKDWKFKLYATWEKDVVQSMPKFPNDKFVKIWWERYYLWKLSDGNPEKNNNPKFFKQVDRPYMWYDDDGNRVQFMWSRICIWSLDDKDNLINWTEIILDKDQNQVRSRETGPKIMVWKDEEQVNYTKIRWKKVEGKKWDENEWTVNEWNEGSWEQDNSTFEAKWRFELWDTKRLDDDQLEALLDEKNSEVLQNILNKCIKLYNDTNHKPSEVWRYNLSNIIVGTLKKVNINLYNSIVNKLWWVEDRKWIVQKFFGLKHGMFSNPKNEIKWIKDMKYPEIDWVEYDEEENQWDRICNALKYLSAAVAKKNKK